MISLIADHRLRVGLSIGIAIYPMDGIDSATLVGNADAALYRAKAQGRATICFFDSDMDQRLRDRRALQHELRTAILHDELVLYYQPQARVGGEIIGFEALVRWNHPGRGLLAAGAFIPIAEESSLIIPIVRMDLARGLPRGGLLAAPAADRSQSVADPVPPRRSSGTGPFGAAGNRAEPAPGSISKSPRAC